MLYRSSTGLGSLGRSDEAVHTMSKLFRPDYMPGHGRNDDGTVSQLYRATCLGRVGMTMALSQLCLCLGMVGMTMALFHSSTRLPAWAW